MGLTLGLILQSLVALSSGVSLNEALPVETFIQPTIAGIAPIKTSFSPLENVEFEVIANLPDSCYSLSSVETRLDRDYDVVLFYVRAIRNSTPCTGKPIEGRAEVSLRPLREGSYEIRELRSLKNWGQVYIESAPHLRDFQWSSQEWAHR